jgi:hypothetical protein
MTIIDFLLIIAIILLWQFSFSHGYLFISAESARDIFNRLALCNYMNNEELRWRVKATGKTRKELVADAQDIYAKSLMDFTSAEKSQIIGLLDKKNINKLIDKNIKFIKINDIDSGWPYTLKNYIVMPAALVGSSDKKDFNRIIEHELYHIKQKHNQRWFNRQYTAMGFNKVPINIINYKTPLLFNPDDEINVKWMLHVGGDNYAMPTLCIGRDGKPFQKILLMVLQNSGNYVEMDSWDFDECPYKQNIYDVWLNTFPDLTAEKLDKMDKNRHSPNEITASKERFERF